MTDKYLGKAHLYFSLSDYEIDPHSRYRKRIFHEGSVHHPPLITTFVFNRSCTDSPSLRITQPQRVARTNYTKDTSVPRLEVPQTKEYAQADLRKKRRRESSIEESASDGSYAEVPPRSPFSPSPSAYETNNDIDNESDSQSGSDCERIRSSGAGSKDKNTALPSKVPISSKVSVISAGLSASSSSSSSITQYSNSRLAERARLASLPPTAHSPAPRASASSNTKSYPIATGQDNVRTVQQAGPHQAVGDTENGADSSLATRTRRATISGAGAISGSSFEAGRLKQEPTDESVSAKSGPMNDSGYTITPGKGKVKLERFSPPPLDLNAPEQPYTAIHATTMTFNSTLSGLDAESSRRRKRSKSNPHASGSMPETVNSVQPESTQPRRRSERGPSSQTFRRALESGDYIQISENGWLCKVHGDHLGGPRSVTRHHESVHLNIVVSCEFCNAQFSRRDAVLRHQRQSSCRLNGDAKVEPILR